MPKKVLLAEDSLTIQKVFELTFAQSDIVLTMVDNGSDAVRLAGEILPDLVVADVTLPGRNGYEVAADLRDAERTSKIPVLILSGSLTPFDEERFRGCGARGVLFKPFESQELVDRLRELLADVEEAARPGKAEGAAAGTEPWDFSDVLEEVDDARGASFGAKQGATAGGEEEGISLGEFDISIEEVEEAPGEAAPEVPAPEVPAPEAGPAAPPEEPQDAFADIDAAIVEEIAPHCEDVAVGEEIPPPVADLTPALAGVEDIEEIEDLEEMELLHKESEAVPPPLPETVEEALLPGTGAAAAPSGPAPVQEEAPEPVPAEPAAPEPPAPEPLVPEPSTPEPPAPEPPAATPGPLADEALVEALRAEFSGRIREVVEKVAAEAVEKVMWDWMDRLSGEFSRQIRESVESVAWEVIPRTAETLIREEIARIREDRGKKTV